MFFTKSMSYDFDISLVKSGDSIAVVVGTSFVISSFKAYQKNIIKFLLRNRLLFIAYF